MSASLVVPVSGPLIWDDRDPAEVSALRQQVEALTKQLAGAPPDLALREPAPGEDVTSASLPTCRRSV